MKQSAILLCLLLLLRADIIAQPCAVPDDFFPEDTVVVCAGSNYTLTAPALHGTPGYTWSTGAATSTVDLDRNGRYWLTITDGVCERSDTVTVLFNSFLLSPQVSDLKMCKGQPAFPLGVTGQQLQWYTGPLTSDPHPGLPAVSTADTGTYIYWFTQTIKGCESPRVPMEVKVIDKPSFDLGEAFIIPCGARGIVLQVVDDGESEYRWSTGSRDVSTLAPSRGTYSLYAENMCGSHRDTTVAVECEDHCVQFPTAFTPNQDGKNDKYAPACFCPVPQFRLVIYNRNGELVYQTNDPNAGWDGYYKGKLQPNGVYVFYSEYYDFILKNTFTKKGTFVLMR